MKTAGVFPLLLALGLLLASFSGAAPAQQTTTFHSRKAWTLESDRIRVTVLAGGGHIASLSAKIQAGAEAGGWSVSPLWVPPWPSIEPDQYTKEKYGSVYGTDSEAPTLAGIMGHNVAFNYWGPPSGAEFQAGLSFHGEASTVTWREASPSARAAKSRGAARGANPAASLDFTYRAGLPKSHTALTRTLRLRPGQPILYIEETAENETPFDRPFGWVEHVTFGPPFLDAQDCFFDASATRAERSLGDRTREFSWPDDADKDFRRFSSDQRSEAMAFALLSPFREGPEFISAVNRRYGLLVAYIFKRQDFPWLNVWEQNRTRMSPPWNGDTRTRGMEFGNTRVSGTGKAYFKLPVQWDTPAFGWMDANARLTARYMAVMIPVPSGVEGVRDILIAGNELLIVPRPDGETIRVTFDPSLF